MHGNRVAGGRVTVLGNFSGRNVGDIAILGNLLAHLGRACPEAEFLVPTLAPAFVRRRFPDPRVRPVGIAPWHGSVKLLGAPLIRAVRASDLVLVTDAVLFDRRLFNPMHNYLSSIAILAAWCRRRGTPMVVYHGSLGPIRTRWGARALREVLAACPVLILRDAPSRALIERLELPSPPIIEGADCAIATEPPPAADVARVLQRLGLAGERPWLGWNVSSYIEQWERYAGAGAAGRFAAMVAGALDRVVRERDVTPVLVATQRMDLRITRAVRDAMAEPHACRIVDATRLDYREAAGLLGRFELVVAMRTHALILAAAGGAPVVNLNVYPKSAGFMQTIRQERWQHQMASLDPDALADLVIEAWDRRAELRWQVQREVRRERSRAMAGVPVVRRLLRAGRRAAERQETRSRLHSAKSRSQ